jgi:competence protein ComEA
MKMPFVFLLPALLLPVVYISQQNQTPPPLGDQSTYPAETHKMSPTEKKDTPSANGQSVDLNTASKKDLAALPDVGPDRAQTIIDARPFRSKEDLLRKKILPQAAYDKIQNMVTANGPKKQSVPANSNQ